jgi:hypothetical protein
MKTRKQAKEKKTMATKESLKTSLRLPKTLWDEARMQAIREGRNAQEIVADALRAYLKKGGAR